MPLDVRRQAEEELLVARLTRSCWPHDCLWYSRKLCDDLKGPLKVEIERVHLHRCGQRDWLGGWQDAYRLPETDCPRHALCGGKTLRYDVINSARQKIPPSGL